MPLHIALIQPQIPPNTGNIARLCAATDSSLHLIEPLGFSIDDSEVRRAGLDYWDAVDLWVHSNWFAFRDAIDRGRCLYFSAKATQSYWEAPYRRNSCLVFGSETEGMPQRILEKHPEQCFTIPMSGPVRSLNLSTAVGIVLRTSQSNRSSPLPLPGWRGAMIWQGTRYGRLLELAPSNMASYRT